MDLSEASLAEVYENGEFDIIWTKKAWIDSKHKKGGQSAARFQRIRQEQIKQWFKEIAWATEGKEPILLDCNSMYRNQLLGYCSWTPFQSISSGYSGITGIYQTIKQKV